MATGRKKSKKKSSPPIGVKPLPLDALRWRCDPDTLPFESTIDVEPLLGIIGQDDAVEALRFGLETNAPGQNIFVRGLSGTGRLTLVRRMMQEIRLACPFTKDVCYVHNFQQPDRPRLITLPPGQGRLFEKRIDKLAEFIRTALGAALTSEGIKTRQNHLEENTRKKLEEFVKPFEQALDAAGLRLVSYQAGPVVQTTIFPVVEGKPIPLEEFDQLHAQGKISDEHYAAVHKDYGPFEERLAEINLRAKEIRGKHEDALGQLLEKSARWILGEVVRDIETEFPDSSVSGYLDEIVEDVVKHRLESLEDGEGFTRLYRVNVVLEHQGEGACPIIAESTPTMRNLLGTIDYEFEPSGEVRANHMGIRAGSLLRADGGYLILDVRDVLGEHGAWKSLVRTLRTGELEIVPPDLNFPRMGPSLKPEPVKINTKVVIIGEAEIYYFLDATDPDFSQLFKVLADFDVMIPRDDTGLKYYAGVLSRIAQEEQLPPFDKSAVGILAEYGARIAGKNNKLSTRFSRIADIAREAAYVSHLKGNGRVTGDSVCEAIHRVRRRADLPSRRFRELVAQGTLRVEVKGEVVGQINGLAVMQAGPMIYGFPARVTATIGPGTAGVINIEREAALSGAIHTKGFYILGGLLRYLLRTDHPLAFEASVAFEQSYGGIDGDSASGAEICCLLSALTDIPLRQDLAMTGAIDQVGHVLAIGAVNEKVEGFYDTCRDLGLTGTQGVIIPKSNADDLMLKDEVLKACREDKFHVYAVETVYEALELFTGMPAGARDKSGQYPQKSVLGIAVRRAKDYWLKAIRSPTQALKAKPQESE